MKKEHTKTWTVLIYAAGQNELSPEIYRSFVDLQVAGAAKNVTIIVQLAKASSGLLHCLRPTALHNDNAGRSGVKRFVIRGQETEELADLGNADMSQPDTLTDFISWGLHTYPAKRVMVILSGHGAGFIGLISDFTRRRRSLMSINGLVLALSRSMAVAQRHIDVLVLDACFTHMVEIWYELALIPKRRIGFLITPLGHLRLEGMAVQHLIQAVGENSRKSSNLPTILANAVRSTNVNATQYGEIMIGALNAQLLLRLKRLASVAARRIRPDDNQFAVGSTMALGDLFAAPALAPLRREAFYLINGLCSIPGVDKVPVGHNLGLSILSPVAQREYLSFQPYYDALHFARENEWTRLLRGTQSPLPVAVPLVSVVTTMLSQNIGLSREQAWNNLRQIGWLNLPMLTGGIQLPPGAEPQPNPLQINSGAPTRSLLLHSDQQNDKHTDKDSTHILM